MKVYNLSLPQGDDKYYCFQFKDSNQNPIDISSWILYLTIKSDLDDSDDDAVLKKTVGPGQPEAHFDPTQGRTKIHLSNTDTENLEGNYYYDFQVKTASGSVITMMTGIFTFEEDITKRT